MALSRREPPARRKPGDFKMPPIPESLVHCDDLWAFLTMEEWPGTTDHREKGTVKLCADDGVLKAIILDNDAGMFRFVTFNTTEEIVVQLDHAVTGGKGDWRPMRDFKGKR
jgi:hypothetical protein